MTLDFDKAWSDLNIRLRDVEQAKGLTVALHELESFHVDSGFIRDQLQDVERYTFAHPDDRDLFFRVQHNPRRAQRFAGSGRKNGQTASLNNGCFLCRENIRWQQDGAQLGYRIGTANRYYHALTNPFPLLPVHIVMASADHRSQEWGFHYGDGQAPDQLIADLVSLAERIPGHIGFYNGVDAGASIPAHLHFQFVKRPEDDLPFPLEVAALHAGGIVDGPGIVSGYPLDVAVWRGQASDVIARAGAWIDEWGERNRPRLDIMTANLIATREDGEDEVVLYFIPRDRTKSRPDGFAGLVGGLEVLGEVVVSSVEEKRMLDAGEIDYFSLRKTLEGVHTPMEFA